MIKAVIIDDEPNNVDNLQSLLQVHCPEVIITGTAMNAAQGKEIILKQQPALVLLDIEMPGGTGFDLLKSLPTYTFEIIFVTAFSQFGIQAVKFAAIDYLLKPIDINELKLAIKKVVERNNQKKQNLQLENFVELMKQNKNDHRIALPTAQQIRFVLPSGIVRCESSNNYTTFYLEDEEKILISKPIYLYEELLKDYGFIRCHQSHLVNKKFIKSFVKGDSGYLLLQNETCVPVSKQKKEDILASLSLA